jgi:hypothetical protein
VVAIVGIFLPAVLSVAADIPSGMVDEFAALGESPFPFPQ